MRLATCYGRGPYPVVESMKRTKYKTYWIVESGGEIRIQGDGMPIGRQVKNVRAAKLLITRLIRKGW